MSHAIIFNKSYYNCLSLPERDLIVDIEKLRNKSPKKSSREKVFTKIKVHQYIIHIQNSWPSPRQRPL